MVVWWFVVKNVMFIFCVIWMVCFDILLVIKVFMLVFMVCFIKFWLFFVYYVICVIFLFCGYFIRILWFNCVVSNCFKFLFLIGLGSLFFIKILIGFILDIVLIWWILSNFVSCWLLLYLGWIFNGKWYVSKLILFFSNVEICFFFMFVMVCDLFF